jgi:inward rectifier potassium channel
VSKKPDLSFTHIRSSEGTRARLVSRGPRRATAIRYGLNNRIFSDLFHTLLGASWARLILLVAGFLLVANLLFAFAFFIDPLSVANVHGGGGLEAYSFSSLVDDFFFSVQTMATVGYGRMWPSDTYGNIVASFEAFFGLISFAMASALLFTRLARPTAKVLFSKVAVMTVRNGRPCLMFRLANARGNQIIEGRISVTLLRREVTLEGEVIRPFIDLPLMRDHTPVLALTWSVIHYIDEQSPFYKATAETLRDREIELVVSFTGVDETYSQQVYARHSYILDEIRWKEKLADIISRDDEGRLVVDYRKFHLTQPHEASASLIG